MASDTTRTRRPLVVASIILSTFMNAIEATIVATAMPRIVGELGDFAGLVRRVVQHLDFEQVAGIVNLANAIDQPVRDIHLVENRKLDRDPRQHRRRR